jgi:hypothetical protein
MQRILVGIALCNSVAFGAQNGALVNLSSQQYIAPMSANNSTTGIAHFEKTSSIQQKQLKKTSAYVGLNDISSQRKILEDAAQKDLLLREQQAKPMSEYITRKYIGEDDAWSFMNQLTAQMGLSDSWHSPESAIHTLTEIYHYFEPAQWTQPIIFDLFYTNSSSYTSRLANLLNGLIAIKRKKYYLVPSVMEPCSASLRGSTIDEFFDENFLFAGLPSPFQQFIQCRIEEEFPRMCLLDKPELAQAHPTTFLILLTALRHCGDDVEEIKSFFTSAAFQKHEKNTDFALTNYIKENRHEGNFWCSWFGVRCKK